MDISPPDILALHTAIIKQDVCKIYQWTLQNCGIYNKITTLQNTPCTNINSQQMHSKFSIHPSRTFEHYHCSSVQSLYQVVVQNSQFKGMRVVDARSQDNSKSKRINDTNYKILSTDRGRRLSSFRLSHWRRFTHPHCFDWSRFTPTLGLPVYVWESFEWIQQPLHTLQYTNG